MFGQSFECSTRHGTEQGIPEDDQAWDLFWLFLELFDKRGKNIGG